MGSSSGACNRCSARKINYDERTPQCSHCNWSGKNSSGIVAQNSLRNDNIYLKLGVLQEQQRDGSTQVKCRKLWVPEYIRRRRITLQEYLRKAVSVPAIYSPGAQKLDPFCSLSIELDSSAQTLIEIYFFYYPRKISTMGPTSIWFPLAAADAVLLEATIFVSASYYAALTRGFSKELAIKHKGLLLRLINERLGDPILAVTDGMICTVALLAGSEGINGRVCEWETHMVGLMRMVTLRSGFQSLGAKSLAVRIIASAYSYGACRSTAEYDFSARADFEKVLLLDGRTVSSILSSRPEHEAQGFPDLFGQVDEPSRQTDADLVRFDEKLAILEYRLAALKRNKPVLDTKSGLYMQECCRLAAFVFTSVYLRERPRLVLVHMDVLMQLKAQLREIELASYKGIQLKVFLWILFVGGTVALGTAEEAWFIGEIAKLLLHIQCLDWESIEASLQGIVKSQNLISLSNTLWLKVQENPPTWD